MGKAYVRGAAARPPRAAASRCRATRSRRTREIQAQCATATASSCARWPSWPASPLERDRGTSSRTGCCCNLVAAFDLREIVGQDEWATAWAEPGATDLPRAGGAILRRRSPVGRRWSPRRCFALPVFGELGTDNDFDDPHAEAVQRARADRRRDRRSRRRRASSRSCGSARRPTRAAAQRRIDAVARGAARSAASRAVRAPTAAAATARSSPRTAARPTCSPTSHGTGDQGAAVLHRARLGGVPDVALGGVAFAAPQVGDQVRAGHRARRAGRVPDPASC